MSIFILSSFIFTSCKHTSIAINSLTYFLEGYVSVIFITCVVYSTVISLQNSSVLHRYQEMYSIPGDVTDKGYKGDRDDIATRVADLEFIVFYDGSNIFIIYFCPKKSSFAARNEADKNLEQESLKW